MSKKIAVIGAGISGLTCAFELKRAGHQVTVFEKNSVVGGRMSTRIKDGFLFDIGADHLCDLYEEMKKYCEEFGIRWERMRFLKYGVFRNGTVMPIKKVLGFFSKIRLAISFLLTGIVGDFFNLSELAKYDTNNAYDLMRRRTGKEVSDYFVDAFSSTYQFHRSNEMSVGVLLGIMHSIHTQQDKWFLHRTRGGMQALPSAFAQKLDVKLNHPVSLVEAGEHVCIDGEIFDAAVLATPATQTRVYYKNPTTLQKQILDQTRYAATISVAFRVDRKKLPDTAIVWVPFVESEKISGYVNQRMKGDELIHDDKSLLCTWLHEGFAKTLLSQSDVYIFDVVKTELLRVCPWIDSAEALENFDLQRWPDAMPKFSHGHLKAVKTFLEGGGQGEQNVFLCGDYLNSPWTEGALRCGQNVANQILLTFK